MSRVLVTGGGGFLGGAIVDLLLARGDEVTSFARGEYPSLAARGVRVLRGDLADREAVLAAARGQDAILHVAAKAGVAGPRAAYVAANVTGTENVIGAALREGVMRVVYTSSPSVVFDGRDHRCPSPDVPYPAKHLAHYPATKARAEQLALSMNGTPLAGGGRLATVSLRPHLVFGPGDPHLVPRLLARADSGKLRIVGDGRNEVSLTYVDNAAAAHVAALDALTDPGAPVAGKAYFVANEEPVRLWEWIDGLLAATGRPRVTKRVPRAVAYAAGAALEASYRALGRADEPPMTRFVALQLATTHTFDVGPLARDAGYREVVGMAEGTRRVVEELNRR